MRIQAPHVPHPPSQAPGASAPEASSGAAAAPHGSSSSAPWDRASDGSLIPPVNPHTATPPAVTADGSSARSPTPPPCGPRADRDAAAIADTAAVAGASCRRERLRRLIQALPKIELHLHIEGTLEPEQVFEMALRHGIELPYADVQSLRDAYQFKDLQSFLDVYYQGTRVLRTSDDFYAMTMAYFDNVAPKNLVHAEIFFDPQSHTDRAEDPVAFDTVLEGITRALDAARSKYGITSKLIMCFLRHEDEASAQRTLDRALQSPYLNRIDAVGLDSGERGNEPEKFERVFARARAAGLRAVAHAGEEGPPEYIENALDRLQVERIDHGVACSDKPELVERLARDRIPLTMCPLSNVKLRVFDALQDHNIKTLLDQGVCVTINSDDPAYFGGYLTDNYLETAMALGLDERDLTQLALNAVEASFLSPDEKRELSARVRAAAQSVV